MTARHPILTELEEAGRIDRAQAEAIEEEHQVQGRTIRQLALDQGFVQEEQYLDAAARLLDTVRVSLDPLPADPELVRRVPASLARMHRLVPVERDGETLVLAVDDVPGPVVQDDLAFVLSAPTRFVLAPAGRIEAALDALYGGREADEAAAFAFDEADLPDADRGIEEAASAGPVIRFVNLVLYQAVRDKASDIHFEPFEKEFKIRYRVDGALYEMEPPPLNLALPVISRVKVLSGLDIAETRLPQDGRIQLDVAGRSIDFRVSTLPTRFGESVVLRVLDRSNVQLDIEQLGFPDDIRPLFLEDIAQPNGIVIVTGPTGSGKTTTLYAALQYINRIETKILTAEDPVEYDVEGIIQLPVHESIGLSFASALRAFLRQDPDVLMVGEIRDLDTARIAVQASLTGHLVFSTLHTNDAPGAVTRLIDMDIEPYLIASTLEAVMGQRLLRTVCPGCREAYTPDMEVLELLELNRRDVGDRPFYRGLGCEACSGSGYRGRHAIFEYMRISDPLREAIMDRQPSVVLRRLAVKDGMRTLREDGIRCILDGLTTVEEVVQYT